MHNPQHMNENSSQFRPLDSQPASRPQATQRSTTSKPSPLGTQSPMRGEASIDRSSSPPVPSSPAQQQKAAKPASQQQQKPSPQQQQQKPPPQLQRQQQWKPTSLNGNSTAKPATSMPSTPLSASPPPLKRKVDSVPPVNESPMPNKRARTQTQAQSNATSAPQPEVATAVPTTSPTEVTDRVEANPHLQQRMIPSLHDADLKEVPQKLLENVLAWASHTVVTKSKVQEQASILSRSRKSTVSRSVLTPATFIFCLTG
jgi:chemotaxis protein histidine kinase CheA